MYIDPTPQKSNKNRTVAMKSLRSHSNVGLTPLQ